MYGQWRWKNLASPSYDSYVGRGVDQGRDPFRPVLHRHSQTVPGHEAT